MRIMQRRNQVLRDLVFVLLRIQSGKLRSFGLNFLRNNISRRTRDSFLFNRDIFNAMSKDNIDQFISGIVAVCGKLV